MNFTPQTEVHLLTGVPFNLTYNNTIDFANINTQTQYFLGKTKYTFDKLTYQRVTANSIKLDINYNDMLDVNYMMFKNKAMQGKWFYAFITNYEFISENVTRVEYQLDVMQTYLFDYEFQSTYVEREHTKRFNSDGTPVINTIDEGLAYGDDYKITNKYKYGDNILWLVCITKKPISRFIGGSQSINVMVSNIKQPLYYSLIPISMDGILVTINGGKIPVNFNDLNDNPDSAGQIVSLFYTQHVPFDYTFNTSTYDLTVSDQNIQLVGSGSTYAYQYSGTKQWTEKTWNVSNNMYQNVLPTYSESKLLMYPYTLIELTDMKGNTVTLKPQNFGNKDLSFKIRPSVSSQPKTAIYPSNYLGNTTGSIKDFTGGIIDNTICDVPVLDDYTASYLQANRNSIAMSNKYAMDNALRGISQNNKNNRLDNFMISKQQGYTESDAKMNMLAGALNLRLGDVATAGYNAIKQYDMLEGQRASMNLNNQFANENLRINAEQQIGMTQAKMNDINNIPPTVSNLGNNTMFDTGWKNTGFYVLIKTIKDEYAAQLTNYFKMFGYKVNKLEIPNTKSRRSYNYIKTVNANIKGDIPNTHLNTIKGIFDRGITIWHTDDIGNYDLNNEEV